eukprot:3264528-Amphidinium_carterae.1
MIRYCLDSHADVPRMEDVIQKQAFCARGTHSRSNARKVYFIFLVPFMFVHTTEKPHDRFGFIRQALLGVVWKQVGGCSSSFA